MGKLFQNNETNTELFLKCKSKVVPVLLTEYHSMKAYRRSWGIARRILDLGTRWRRVVNFTSRPLYPQGKRSWYPLHRRLGGPRRW